MNQITVDAIPNQKFTVQLDKVRYDITIKSINYVTICTIVRDGVTVCDNIRCLPNALLLPYLAMENESGNFIWLTQDDEYPEYTQFGVTQYLMYLTADEMAAYRGGV